MGCSGERTGSVTQLTKYLPGINTQRPGFKPPALYKLSTVAHACDPSTWKVETAESQIQGPQWLCCKVDLKPCFKSKKPGDDF